MLPTLSTVVETASAIGLGVVVVILLVAGWFRRRALIRRLTLATLRLDESEAANDPRGVDRNLARLERAIDRTVLRSGEASVAETRLAQVLEVIPQGVIVYDDQREMLFANRPAHRYLRAQQHDADLPRAIEELVERALDGMKETTTLELLGPPRRTLVVATSTLDNERRTVGALVVIEDVSERRRLELVRRDFVSNISHELKTPIGALALLAETVADEEDAAVAQRLAERMVTEAFRVSRTIDDLLELSRIEAEEAPQREPVPVHLVLADAVERIREAADNSRIKLNVEEPPKRLTIMGDRRQLVSALYNLLDNAVKYSDTESVIDVNTKFNGESIEIAVRDHGLGIPARDIERVFERFYRVDRARSRVTGGTGLGLAIVRHVASNHQGDVRAESEEGVGSTFTLILPAGPGLAAVRAAEGT